MISRRDFLKDASLALAAAAAARPLAAGAATTEIGQLVPGKEGMILHSLRFLDLEMPMEFADSWITPVPHFYVRNHMREPETLDASEWQLSIGGEVEKPLSLSLSGLGQMESHSVTNTLECAGNGRAFQRPQAPGIQWRRGAVGNALFTGTRLRDLLQRAGVRGSAKHVMFRGLDEAPGQVPQFIRSIPIEKAMDEDTLVATQMNGAPLLKHHGFPARALVPGWLGAASCKWLSEINVLDKEFEGNFMSPGYRFPDERVEPGGSVAAGDTHAITGLNVKSVIAHPLDGRTVAMGAVSVRGLAWAGEADIVKVEISTGEGAPWVAAQLGTEKARYAWRLWRYSWHPPRVGDYLIRSRATDSQGRIQPESGAWNPSGYLYNAIDQVRIHVRA